MATRWRAARDIHPMIGAAGGKASDMRNLLTTLTMASGAMLAFTAPAAAQTFPIKWSSHQSSYFRGVNPIVLPTYHITFIISQQATAVGGGAKARSTVTLTGIDEAMLRRLADEAHADLRARFAEAGYTLVSDEQARAMVAANAIPLMPDNRDVVIKEGGITINKSVRQSYVTVGATAVPALEPYRYGANTMALIKVNGRLAKGQPQGTLAVIPNLVLDFANMGASTSSSSKANRASAGGEIGFTFRGISSGVFVVKVIGGNYMFPAFIRPVSDVTVTTPFARVERGGAAVAPLSIGGSSIARGDAVVVDREAWEELVRTAFKDYNAAIVSAVVKGRG